MALVVADRVQETTSTTSTSSYSLSGAVLGFRAFSSVCVDGDTVYYTAENGTDWEVGLGTWGTGNVLARTIILSSSNSGSAVNWSAGSKNVFLTVPAFQVLTLNTPDYLIATQGVI